MQEPNRSILSALPLDKQITVIFDLANGRCKLENLPNGSLSIDWGTRKEWWHKGVWRRTDFFNAEGKCHSEDGPAVIYADGTRIWFQNGQKHRVDGPAIEHPDGH
ncbi:MAG TPA: hypothetical protein VHP34_05450, partial [Alphaproteobacteria bacterium]|nr:hypothetical protein [Alphaproteobacteria bacterium]